MKVSFIDLNRQHKPIKKKLMEVFEGILDNSQFILGEKVKQFEEEVGNYVGTKYAIGVSNGTDALLLSLKALGIGPGDEVITTPFTFIATAEVIAILGAKPVFCDIDPKTFNIDPDKITELISDRTKAILPVHLFGQAADMDEIMRIAKENNLKVVEDMAQAIGSKYKGKKVGTFGDTACISFFPTKNLSALGDGGMILTNNEELALRLRAVRIHGAFKKYYHDFLGYNNRLDAMQAAFLQVKLKYLDEWNEKRREIANKYNKTLQEFTQIPYIDQNNVTVYHQYTIRAQKRDELRQYLTEKDISTGIHYPMPLHFQNVFKYLGYKEGDIPEAEKASKEVLSLPIHQDLTDEEINYVIDTIREYFRK